MGIYIKGMEIPKDIEPGLVIEFADGVCGKRYARLFHYRYGSLTEWLEAVSVPPHGRLIDADALITTFCEWGTRLERGRKLVITMSEAKQAIVDIIEDAPTIIPAEEGDT